MDLSLILTVLQCALFVRQVLSPVRTLLCAICASLDPMPPLKVPLLALSAPQAAQLQATGVLLSALCAVLVSTLLLMELQTVLHVLRAPSLQTPTPLPALHAPLEVLPNTTPRRHALHARQGPTLRQTLLSALYVSPAVSLKKRAQRGAPCAGQDNFLTSGVLAIVRCALAALSPIRTVQRSAACALLGPSQKLMRQCATCAVREATQTRMGQRSVGRVPQEAAREGW